MKKHLAKSIVLGLLLASIGNCVWAAEDSTRVFQGDQVFDKTLGGLCESKDDVKVKDGSLTINITDTSYDNSGVCDDDGTHNVSLDVSGDININTTLSKSNGYSASICATKDTNVISGGHINITSENTHASHSYGIIATYLNCNASISAANDLVVSTKNSGYNYGLAVNYGNINVDAKNIKIDTESNAMNIAVQALQSGRIELNAKEKVEIVSKGKNSYGIWSCGIII